MNMKKKLVSVLIASGVLLSNSSCDNRVRKEENAMLVRLHKVETNGCTDTSKIPGRVNASEEVNLAFKVSGTLRQVFVKEGDRISEGQLVAEIDPRDYQLQFDAVEAEYLKVKSEAERVIALYSDSVATADAYDKARYGLRQITAKYENTKNQLEDTKIYAPFDGYVQTCYFDPPTVVAAGMPVLTLVSGGDPEIEINVPASTYMRRHDIASCSASFDFLPNKEIPLRLIGFSPKANANQLYAVRLSIPSDMSPQPAPGMSTMVSIVFDKSDNAQVRIPATALFKDGNDTCVWIYDESGTVKRRTVAVEKLRTDGSAVIADGIAAGETIVCSGVHKLKNDQKVKPMPAVSETNVGGLL